MTVKGNLLIGAYARRDQAGIQQDLEMVYSYFPILRERATSPAGFLSGGQQQMLAIGRGLMARPRLMLLDEPSLGLSPLLTKEIFGIIRRLNQERNVTMLLVEQNANMALHTAHYGYVLEVGRIVLDGACAKLTENEDVREFYLGQKETAVRGKKRWKRTKRWR
jgi:branched-chain amino acid transport system ATP-binding protein